MPVSRLTGAGGLGLPVTDLPLHPFLGTRHGHRVESATLQEMVNICEEAVVAVLGQGVITFLAQDDRLADRAAPWVWDLARGLHYQSMCGSQVPLTIKLLDQLSHIPLEDWERNLFTDKIDWAFILTEDRVAEFVQGRGAIGLDPVSRQRSFP